MNEKRKRLLIELENIVGNEFYNGNIQNWGPGGVFEGEGRALRYPVTFRDKDGKTIKTKHVDPALPADTVITGMYRLGANEQSTRCRSRAGMVRRPCPRQQITR